MEAACGGARSAESLTVGLLPGVRADDANPFVDVAIPTGLGEARNALVVRAGEAVIAIGGGFGTLAEVALALKAGTPVVGLETWELARGGEAVEAIQQAESAHEAVERALAAVRAGRQGQEPA